MVFGFVAGWIAVFEGYDAVPNTEGVSRATTRTVVYTAFAVLGLDFILTALMFGDISGMQSKTVEIMVGMFVAAGIAALFMLAMKVSNLASFTDQRATKSDRALREHRRLESAFAGDHGRRARRPRVGHRVRHGELPGPGPSHRRYAVTTSLPTDTTASIYTAGLLGEQYIGLEPGADEDFLKAGDEIKLTQSAVVMEQLIGQMLFSKAAEGRGELAP